jgi:NAD(P)-dependent dehydrogenase (short-subunit alcohol dehydrogenase family)
MNKATKIDLRGKHMIVSGASENSLGFATACLLAEWGARVTITTRSHTERVVKLLCQKSGGLVDGHDMDLTDAASVAAFANWYQQTHNHLDVLINNAGIHLDLRSEWKSPHLTADGHEIHWRTNYLGTFQLTELLLPLLLQSAKKMGEARVVNIVSQLHSKGRNAALFTTLTPYNSWRAYGTSKLALVHFSTELQRRYGEQGLSAYCLHPGAVYTRIADKGLDGHLLIAVLRKLLAPLERILLLSPEQGAQTSVHCATAPHLPGGRYYVNCVEKSPSADAQDASVAARLFDQSRQWFKTVY